MRQCYVLLFIGSLLGCLFATVARADFGQALVDEAIDLISSQLGDDGSDDPRYMEDLLHWAISHSDLEKLAAQAEEAQRIQMVRDLKEQRRRVKELLDHVRSQPTETDMMKEGIAILQRPRASDTELLAALQALQVLVEPIDNANDLHPLGGIAAVVAQLTRGPEVAAAAAYVLGTAASNNPSFQRVLLAEHPDIVETLLQMSQSRQEEAAVKGMYALAALIRNLSETRRAFASAGGFGALEELLRGESVAARVKRRALSLFMDLVDIRPAGAEAGAGAAAVSSGSDSSSDSSSGPQIRTLHHLDGEAWAGTTAATASGPSADAAVGPTAHGDDVLTTAAIAAGLPQAVVALLVEQDPDMQEKALLVMQRLAGSATARRALRESGAEEAILELREQLRADAPEPGGEPDPYHEFLEGLVRQVSALMMQPDALHTGEEEGAQQHQQSRHGTGADTVGVGTGVDAGASSGKARGRGSSGVGSGSLEPPAQQQVLALGGPTVGLPKAKGEVRESEIEAEATEGVAIVGERDGVQVAGQCGMSSGAEQQCQAADVKQRGPEAAAEDVV